MALVGWKNVGNLILSHRNVQARHAPREQKIALVVARKDELFLQEIERFRDASAPNFLPSNCVKPEREGDIFILRDKAEEICLRTGQGRKNYPQAGIGQLALSFETARRCVSLRHEVEQIEIRRMMLVAKTPDQVRLLQKLGPSPIGRGRSEHQ
jgi:hypothetical protein